MYQYEEAWNDKCRVALHMCRKRQIKGGNIICQGKRSRVFTAQGKWLEKKSYRGNHREFWNFVQKKHRENTRLWYAQVVDSLILKIKDIAIITALFPIFNLEMKCVYQVSLA